MKAPTPKKPTVAKTTSTNATKQALEAAKNDTTAAPSTTDTTAAPAGTTAVDTSTDQSNAEGNAGGSESDDTADAGTSATDAASDGAVTSTTTEGEGVSEESGSTPEADAPSLPDTVKAQDSTPATPAPSRDEALNAAAERLGVRVYHVKSKDNIVPVREHITLFSPVKNSELDTAEYTSLHQIKHNIDDKALEKYALEAFTSEVHSQLQLERRRG